MSPSAPPRRHSSLTGIAFKIGAVLIFLVMSALLKAANRIPAGELVFFRSFFGLFPVVIFLAVQGQLAAGIRTKNLAGQIWRGGIGSVSMALNFYAIIALPLPESVTLGYAMPLIIVVLSAIFLGEVVRLHRWSAVIIGFIGVVIIAWPRLTLFTTGVDSAAAIGVGAALCGAAMGGVAQLLVRKLTQTERSATIVLYFLGVSSLASLLTIPFGWLWPTPLEAALLISAGICGGVAQIMLTESYRHAELSVVAPFEYSSLIFSLIIGFIFFGDVPTWFMLVGGVIVVGSGLYIIFRERQLGLARPDVEEVVTPQG